MPLTVFYFLSCQERVRVKLSKDINCNLFELNDFLVFIIVSENDNRGVIE